MTARLLPQGVPLSKRSFDLILTIPLLAVISPLLGLIGLLVRIILGTPVLFLQMRPGKDGEPFTVYKFRTMSDERDSNQRLLSDAERMTGLGRFLRSFSLDELPELYNVLRGEMSLVGPRPLLMQYLPRYSPEQSRRHYVRPGLTGWTQVNGRNALGWPEKLALDTWYVDNRSFMLDLKIMAMTVKQILVREGIAHDGSETMPEFMGDDRTRS